MGGVTKATKIHEAVVTATPITNCIVGAGAPPFLFQTKKTIAIRNETAIAVISAAAFTRHQNQRKSSSNPVPEPIWSNSSKELRASLRTRASAQAAPISSGVARRPTHTSSVSLAPGLMKRLYRSFTRMLEPQFTWVDIVLM